MNDPMSGDPREGKLPHWAQNLFRELRTRVLRAEQHAEEARLLTRPEASPVVIPRFRRGDDIGLGDATVRFRAIEGHWDNHFDVRVLTADEGGIIVHAGRGPIYIQPVSSNVVHIRQVER